MFQIIRYPAGGIEIEVRPLSKATVPALPLMVAGQLIETLGNGTFRIVEATVKEWRRHDGYIAYTWVYEVKPEHP